jgi:hypothetical protein
MRPVLQALRALDQRPAGCPDFAHRMTLHLALLKRGVQSTPGTAVAIARDLVAPRVLQ